MSSDELRARIAGPVCSFPTPFTHDGAIDEQAAHRIIDVAIDGGSEMIMLTLGDSLFTILTDDEVADLTRLVVEHVAGRALVVAADRMWWTGKVVEFATYCRDVGVDILMIRPPDWGGSPSPESLAAHYAAAAAVMPVMLVGMPPLRTLEILANMTPNVVAFKEDMDLSYSFQVARQYGDRWPMIAGGGKARHLMLWPAGVRASLSIYIRLAPDVPRAYWQALREGNLAEARRVVDTYDQPLFRMGETFPGGLDSLQHCAMELFGIAPRWRRSPYVTADDEAIEQLRGFFQDVGLLATR
ncbi:MAG: dihydrodipicolinate synthase family protein [Candidatus Latescibacteria bacterium]|nr:dihydrodipicolinate synthase family protein [Candidatus Latescibacterota bacterium]